MLDDRNSGRPNDFILWISCVLERAESEDSASVLTDRVMDDDHKLGIRLPYSHIEKEARGYFDR